MNVIQKDNREIEGEEALAKVVEKVELAEKEQVEEVEENFNNKPEEGNVKGSFGTGYDKDSWNKDEVNKDDNKEVVEE